jgi:hypothetical protein
MMADELFMTICFMAMLCNQLSALTREQTEFTCEIPDFACLRLVPRFGTMSKLLLLPSNQVRSIWPGLSPRAVATACTGSGRSQDTAAADQARKVFMGAKNQLRSSGEIAYN